MTTHNTNPAALYTIRIHRGTAVYAGAITAITHPAGVALAASVRSTTSREPYLFTWYTDGQYTLTTPADPDHALASGDVADLDMLINVPEFPTVTA